MNSLPVTDTPPMTALPVTTPPADAPPVTMPLPVEDIQGNILRGYRMPNVRHFVLGVKNVATAKQVLSAWANQEDDNALHITNAEIWDTKPVYCLNIAFTFAGLHALGLPQTTLDSFPAEFRAGAAGAAQSIGDVGQSDPHNWLPGLAASGDAPPAIHILLSLYACDKPMLETLSEALRKQFTAAGAMTEYSCQDGEALPDARVHFGYVDSLSQPHVAGAEAPKSAVMHDPSPTGDFLLGYPGYYMTYPLPTPAPLGRNGTFCAYRILRQDVVGFETYIEKAAAETKLHKELLAAKMCGRWRSGVPLALCPETDAPKPPMTLEQMNAFDYRPTTEYPDANDDWRGFRCPIGAHIRRANPRSEDVAGNVHPTAVVNGVTLVTESGTPRRIIRRGIPYGPHYSPDAGGDAVQEEAVERGLLLLVLCASLHEQFEFLMTQWINGQIFTSDPSQATLPKDPLLGNIGDGEGQFTFPVQGKPPVHLQGFSRFVSTQGSAYGFIPSITDLHYLAQPSY